MTRDEILAAHPLETVLPRYGIELKKQGAELVGLCPFHNDHHPSLRVNPAKRVWCCDPCKIGGSVIDFVARKEGISDGDAFKKLGGNGTRQATPNTPRREVCAYDYRDENGKLLFQVVRYEPGRNGKTKDFEQRRPDDKGGWIYKLKDVRRVLYRLPQIKAAPEVWIIEGEKDADNLAALGFATTCNSGGAGKWLASYSETLRGSAVVILPDADAPGQAHAENVAAALHDVAANVRVVAVPDGCKDISDWLATQPDKGAAKQRLIALAKSAPEWKPKAAPAVAESERDFDKITADIRGEILAILTDENCKGSARNCEVAKLVVGALARVGRLYFHAERRDFESAMFFDASAKRLLRIRADAFGAWLSEWLGINRADPLFKYAFAEVETAALSGAQTTAILPEAFWASRFGAIYLSNGDGQLVKITAQGVTLADNGTDGVLFAAGRTLAPWKFTEPRDAFETCRLFRDAHCSAAHGKDLLRLWLYSLPSNPPSKPPLCLPGAIGSGKTRTAKGFAELFGIPFVAHKVEEGAEDSFWPCCDAGGIFILDNADTRCRWLADALANAATDGCSQRRKLYTNNETVILRARAWLCITTANPTFAADSGLADRLLPVRMERRDGEETSDAELGAEILAARDAGLSHLAHTLRAALADTAPTPPGLNARHPDFAAFAVKIGRALGREAEAVAALRSAETDKSAFCLENDDVGAVLLNFMQQNQFWRGTAAELLDGFKEIDADFAATRDNGKPLWSAKRVGKRLSALWPHVCKAFPTACKETDRKGFTIFTLKVAECAEFQTTIS